MDSLVIKKQPLEKLSIDMYLFFFFYDWWVPQGHSRHLLTFTHTLPDLLLPTTTIIRVNLRHLLFSLGLILLEGQLLGLGEVTIRDWRLRSRLKP